MKSYFLSALVSVMMLLFGSVAGAQTMTILAEENPPFNTVKNGVAEGAASDLFVAMAAKAGLTITKADIKTQPWARAYESAQTQPNTVLFPMARTPAREPLFKWIGPIYKVQIGLIALKSKKLVIKDAATAAKYIIGTVRDGAPEQAIIAAGVSVDRLDRGADLMSNLKKLQTGRIDMLAFNAVAANYNMAAAGMNPDDYEVVFVLSEPQLYFAVHKDMAASTVQAMQDALDAMKKDGSYETIIRRYIK